MRLILVAAGAALLVLLAGCVDLTSVHPLATPETVTFDASLIGEWTSGDKDDGGKAFIRAAPGGAKAYDIIWAPDEADEEPLRLKGQLVKVGNRLVFDLITTKKQDMAVPVHFFMLVDRQEETLKLQWLDSEWLRDQVVSQQALAYTMYGDKPVITSRGAEINAFLAKFGLDARAAADTLVFTRVKAQ
jgi:hypothetical protein